MYINKYIQYKILKMSFLPFFNSPSTLNTKKIEGYEITNNDSNESVKPTLANQPISAGTINDVVKTTTSQLINIFGSDYNSKNSRQKLPIVFEKNEYNQYNVLTPTNDGQRTGTDSGHGELNSHSTDSNDDDEQLPVTMFKMDYTTQFYVGSLTVVGLFVLYKMIQRTR